MSLYQERESERFEDECGGMAWLLNLGTGEIEKVEGAYLIGVGPPDGYVNVNDLSQVARIAILGSAER